jgi:hypothetical protein
MIHDLDHLIAKAMRLGLWINVIGPAAIAALAYLLHESGTVPTSPEFEYGQPALSYVLVVVAIGELITAFVLRRIFFSADRTRPIRHDPELVEQWLLRSLGVIFALGAAPVAYGAVLFLLSGDIRQLALFGIVSLLAYRLFRPTKDLLESALDEAPRN